MKILYVVLPLALLIAACAVWGFSWAIRRGQFDDLETPSQRMLLDDDPVSPDPARDSTQTEPSADSTDVKPQR